MQNTPSLLDPDAFVTQKLREEKDKEISIAVEVYLAEKCVRLHYQDLMDGAPPGLASKTSLVSWLNDNVRKGQLVREGIITRYQKKRPSHFRGDGTWRPSCFISFLDFCKDELTNKSFVGKRNAAMYSQSFQNADWVAKASAVMGLKMLERMYKQGTLNSTLSKVILEINFKSRELLEASGRIIGRVAKNNGQSYEIASEIQDLFERHFKEQFYLAMKRYEQHSDYRLYLEYKPVIETEIQRLPLRLMEKRCEYVALGN